MAKPLRIVSVSDWHLWSGFTKLNEKFSSFEKSYMGAFKGQLKDATHCVLNGDIVELTNQLLPTKKVIEEAVIWLEKLIEKHPDCKFSYVLGNHDAVDKFYEELRTLQKKHKNFEVHDTQVKIRNIMFLHGDLPLEGKSLRERSLKKAEKSKESDLNNLAYELAHGKILKSMNRIWNRPAKIVGMLVQAITGNRDFDEIEHVVIGHTHVPFFGLQGSDGRHYYNTGGPLKALDEYILTMDVDEENRVSATPLRIAAVKMADPPGGATR